MDSDIGVRGVEMRAVVVEFRPYLPVLIEVTERRGNRVRPVRRD